MRNLRLNALTIYGVCSFGGVILTVILCAPSTAKSLVVKNASCSVAVAAGWVFLGAQAVRVLACLSPGLSACILGLLVGFSVLEDGADSSDVAQDSVGPLDVMDSVLFRVDAIHAQKKYALVMIVDPNLGHHHQVPILRIALKHVPSNKNKPSRNALSIALILFSCLPRFHQHM